MIDVRCEQVLTLSQVAREVPGRPHVGTIVRWAGRGIKGVKLETVLVGGRRYTSLEAIQRFLARLNGSRIQPAQTSVLRERHLALVEQTLAQEGL